MRLQIVALTLIGLLSGSAACSSSTESRQELELSAVPTSITIDGQPVELTAYAWRDFMPVSPPNGKPLIVIVSLPDDLPSVTVERLWVSFGEEVWETAVEHMAGTNSWRADGGPKWEPGVVVEVVAQLRDQDGSPLHVRDTEVQVTRTD